MINSPVSHVSHYHYKPKVFRKTFDLYQAGTNSKPNHTLGYIGGKSDQQIRIFSYFYYIFDISIQVPMYICMHLVKTETLAAGEIFILIWMVRDTTVQRQELGGHPKKNGKLALILFLPIN